MCSFIIKIFFIKIEFSSVHSTFQIIRINAHKSTSNLCQLTRADQLILLHLRSVHKNDRKCVTSSYWWWTTNKRCRHNFVPIQEDFILQDQKKKFEEVFRFEGRWEKDRKFVLDLEITRSRERKRETLSLPTHSGLTRSRRKTFRGTTEGEWLFIYNSSNAAFIITWRTLRKWAKITPSTPQFPELRPSSLGKSMR